MKKKLASLALSIGTVGASFAGMSTANAASTQSYLNAPVSFSSKAACVADANAEKAKITAAGDSLTDRLDWEHFSGQCYISDSGYTHAESYSGSKKVDASDIAGSVVIYGDSSPAIKKALAQPTQTEYSHVYAFATKADCLNHYNSVLATLKADSNVEIEYTSDGRASSGQAACGSDGYEYQYGIDYVQNRHLKAPFGYEKTQTTNLYHVGTPYSASGHTDPSGNFVLDEVLS